MDIYGLDTSVCNSNNNNKNNNNKVFLNILKASH